MENTEHLHIVKETQITRGHSFPLQNFWPINYCFAAETSGTVEFTFFHGNCPICGKTLHHQCIYLAVWHQTSKQQFTSHTYNLPWFTNSSCSRYSMVKLCIHVILSQVNNILFSQSLSN